MKNGCSIWSVSERRKRGKNIEQREPRRLPRQRLPLTVLCSLSGLGGRRAQAVTACSRSRRHGDSESTSAPAAVLLVTRLTHESESLAPDARGAA